ncbi:hypothetical protein GQ53DRAFT_293382 [Thozetella sp. PMI_491]|nr:hypothetical protein GQ53DRAFT_293382 [Thozetella sp. PMI_491]
MIRWVLEGASMEDFGTVPPGWARVHGGRPRTTETSRFLEGGGQGLARWLVLLHASNQTGKEEKTGRSGRQVQGLVRSRWGLMSAPSHAVTWCACASGRDARDSSASPADLALGWRRGIYTGEVGRQDKAHRTHWCSTQGDWGYGAGTGADLT